MTLKEPLYAKLLTEERPNIRPITRANTMQEQP